MSEPTREPMAGEVWREADGVLLLCLKPGVMWKSFTEYVPWDAPLIARPLTRLVDAKGNLVNDDIETLTAERDEAQMERSDAIIEINNLRKHIDAVYNLLDERYTAAKFGSKSEVALSEVMTFMEMNPVLSPMKHDHKSRMSTEQFRKLPYSYVVTQECIAGHKCRRPDECPHQPLSYSGRP